MKLAYHLARFDQSLGVQCKHFGSIFKDKCTLNCMEKYLRTNQRVSQRFHEFQMIANENMLALAQKIFLVLTSTVRSLNILGIFPYHGTSHFLVFRVYLRELANRGHNVTVISHFPEKNPPANYQDISLAGTIEVLKDDMPVEKSYTSIINTALFLTFTGKENCEVMVKNKQVQDLVHSKAKFDVVVVEQFNSDCAFGIAYKLKAPVVGMMSHILMPWHYQRLGIPYNTAYVPFHFLEGGTKPSLYQRVERVLFDTLKKFVDEAKHGVIYISFGSVISPSSLSHERVKAILEVVSELPQRFIWKWNNKTLLKAQDKLYTDKKNPPANYQDISLAGTIEVLKDDMPVEKSYTSIINTALFLVHWKRNCEVMTLKKFVDEAKHGVIYISFGSVISPSSLSHERSSLPALVDTSVSNGTRDTSFSITDSKDNPLYTCSSLNRTSLYEAGGFGSWKWLIRSSLPALVDTSVSNGTRDTSFSITDSKDNPLYTCSSLNRTSLYEAGGFGSWKWLIRVTSWSRMANSRINHAGTDNFSILHKWHSTCDRNVHLARELCHESQFHGFDSGACKQVLESYGASVRCLAYRGRFLEIGKFDISNNTPIGMYFFLKETSFHGIMLDYIFDQSFDFRLVIEIIKKGKVSMQQGSVEYYWRSKYDVMETEDKDFLIVKKKSINDPSVRIVATEEYFDILTEIHKTTGHEAEIEIHHSLQSNKSTICIPSENENVLSEIESAEDIHVQIDMMPMNTDTHITNGRNASPRSDIISLPHIYLGKQNTDGIFTSSSNVELVREFNLKGAKQKSRLESCQLAYVCRIGAGNLLSRRDLQPNASERMHNAYKVNSKSIEP
ncbi:hypothetical protein MSG28_004706 [Choristoneura fumiferana]|uniref:Uncharacterized protein n=1 Tax=Choristoneura fumiferana TaxID=7141 RepID=A0ACC0K7Q0_CHOFU|nr:hypothetical protein MSG28_004706 [Choristoneura fumiferana]